MSTRQAERLNTDPTFQAELQQRLAELDVEDQRALLQHRREVLRAAKYALATQVVLLSERSPAVRDRASGAIEAHLSRLLPQAIDLAVVDASPAEDLRQRRTLRDVFDLPDDTHDAEVVDLARVLYEGLWGPKHREELARQQAARPDAPPATKPPASRDPAEVPPAVEEPARDQPAEPVFIPALQQAAAEGLPSFAARMAPAVHSAEDPPPVEEPIPAAAPEPPAHVAATPADPPQPEPLQPTATPVVRPMVGFPDEHGRILQPDGSYVRDFRFSPARREEPPPPAPVPIRPPADAQQRGDAPLPTRPPPDPGRDHAEERRWEAEERQRQQRTRRFQRAMPS